MSLANKSPNKKEQLMPKNPYILFEYTLNGNLVVSAIHYYDISKFRLEHPDAKIKVAKWKVISSVTIAVTLNLGQCVTISNIPKIVRN
jgi:hypothetical protein